MDFDFSTLLYILFAIVYFVFSSGKKKQKKPNRPTPQPRQAPPQRTQMDSKRPTFEELLQELKNERKEEPAKPRPVAVVEEKKPTIKEKSITTAYDQVEHRSIKTNFEHFEEFEETAEEPTTSLELNDPEAARKAFIYSEIFKRKY